MFCQRVRRALWSCEEGAALVETAIALALLAPILMGFVEFGLAMYEWSRVNRTAEATMLYVANNADKLYAENNINISEIITSSQVNSYGNSLTVAVGCSCPITKSIDNCSIGGLAPFQNSPLPKCSQALVCSNNTTPQAPYVFICASAAHNAIASDWIVGPLKSSTFVRLQ